ncbi:uncharacterized protein TNCV_3977221 [Trichonephila clavipes]|nr:uncharacterized protein TNCV_3977221 [Trichonephila clavipes]
MPLHRFRRKYQQLSLFERKRIIGMLETKGWSARQVTRQLGRSDCIVRGCWDHTVDPRDVIYTKTRLRTPSTDQSSRRLPHRKKYVYSELFHWPPSDTGSTFARGAWLKDI